MGSQEAMVARYTDGFRRGDLAQVLSWVARIRSCIWTG